MKWRLDLQRVEGFPWLENPGRPPAKKSDRTPGCSAPKTWVKSTPTKVKATASANRRPARYDPRPRSWAAIAASVVVASCGAGLGPTKRLFHGKAGELLQQKGVQVVDDPVGPQEVR